MEQSLTNWTKDELNVYILLYAAKVDYEITIEEKEKIIEKYSIETYSKLFDEIKLDNDYASIDKIKNAIKQLDLSNAEIEESMQDVKIIFEADGKFDSIEKGVYNVLNKVLNS